MLILTDERGQPVTTADGTRVGRVIELAVDASDPLARISRIGIGPRRTVQRWVDWSGVAAFERTAVQLRAGAVLEANDRADRRPTSELWLVRDVLDSQILDPDGGRLVRVGDIVLTRVDGDLRVVAVEFGTGPVLRRLGLRRWGERLAPRSIGWSDLHLVSGHGLAAQLEVLPGRPLGMNSSQLALLIAQIPATRASRLLHAVGPEAAATALGLTHPEVRARVVESLPDRFAGEMFGHMASDDATQALRRLPHDVRHRLLNSVDSSRAIELKLLLSHPPDTAGGLMSPEFQTIPWDTTTMVPLPENIQQALIESAAAARDYVGTFVVDDTGSPVGVIEPTSIIDRTFTTKPISAMTPLSTRSSLDDVIGRFATEDVDALPVIDDRGAMVGVITTADVLEELVAERLPGRRRFQHVLGRHRHRPARRTALGTER